MHAYGWFDVIPEREPRPFVHAWVSHPGPAGPQAVNFLVDTGADHTYLGLEDQKMLEIAPGSVTKAPEEVRTLGGMIRFFVLPHCTIWISNHLDEDFYAEDVRLYLSTPDIDKFFKTRKARQMGYGSSSITRIINKFLKTRKARQVGHSSGFVPSIIGRDVLSKLALSHCQSRKHLMVTDETDAYCDLVEVRFPPPGGGGPFGAPRRGDP